jgi:hypothetical protein
MDELSHYAFTCQRLHISCDHRLCDKMGTDMRRWMIISAVVLTLCTHITLSASAECKKVTERMMFVQNGGPSRNSALVPITVGAVPSGDLPCPPASNRFSPYRYLVTPAVYEQQLFPMVRQDCTTHEHASPAPPERGLPDWGVIIFHNDAQVAKCSISDNDLDVIFAHIIKQDKRNTVRSNQ